MSKYHRAFKLEIAKRAEQISSNELSKQFNITSRQIRYWSSVYQIHGLDSFRHQGIPYNQSFKLDVLQHMQANHWSLSYTCAYFDLSSPGILHKWLQLYNTGGSTNLIQRQHRRPRMTSPSSQNKPAEQMTEKELRRELEYLRAENAVLKKLEALAQQIKKQIKTKP
jgi:transposase